MQFDGSEMLQGSGAGVIFTSPEDIGFIMSFKIISGQRIILWNMKQSCMACVDNGDGHSQNYMLWQLEFGGTASFGNCEAENDNMASYHVEVARMGDHLDGCRLDHIDHKKNDTTDSLDRFRSSRI